MARPRVVRWLGKAIALVKDPGQATWHPGGMGFRTNLSVSVVNPDGSVAKTIDLGSGVTTATGAGSGNNGMFYTSGWAVSTTANWHISTGTGTTAATSGDGNLQTAIGGNTVVATTSVSGATLTLTGTTSYSNTYAVTEWAVFLLTSGTATAWLSTMFCFDRRTFAAINVVNGQNLVWTYTLTLVAGG